MLVATATFFIVVSTRRWRIRRVDRKSSAHPIVGIIDAGVLQDLQQLRLCYDLYVSGVDDRVLRSWLVLHGKPPAVDSTMRAADHRHAHGRAWRIAGFECLLQLLFCFRRY